MDKFDEAGILIRPTVKLEREMDIEGKNKSELWDYYQDLVKVHGFNGITDLLTENARLRAVIDEANAQKPFAYCYTDVNGCAKELCESPDCQIPQDKRVITALYCSPTPAQQSPAVAVPSEYKIKLLPGDYAHGSMGKEQYLLCRDRFIEDGCKDVDKGIFMERDYFGWRNVNNGEGFVFSSFRDDYEGRYLTFDQIMEKRPVYEPAPSPRITEQDARANGAEVYLFRRKGLEPFLTCSRERFDELSRNDSFETKILYEPPNTEPSDIVRQLSAPYPHPRISEHDAREICSAYNAFRMQGHAMEPLGIINKWLNSDGLALLNKLNDKTESEQPSVVGSNLYKDGQCLRVSISGDYLALYDKENERVCQYKLDPEFGGAPSLIFKSHYNKAEYDARDEITKHVQLLEKVKCELADMSASKDFDVDALRRKARRMCRGIRKAIGDQA